MKINKGLHRRPGKDSFLHVKLHFPLNVPCYIKWKTCTALNAV